MDISHLKKRLSKTEILNIIEPILSEDWQTLKDIQKQTKPQLSVGCISMTIFRKLSKKVESSLIHTGNEEWQSTQIFRLKKIS